MKLITKDTDYAVRALVHLAEKEGEFVSAREIARSENIPEYYLKRIQQRLIKARVLTSKEGVKGGVTLARRPSDIRVSEILAIFQGPFELSACMFRRDPCPNRESCVFRRRINAIKEKLAREFAAISIRDLAADKKMAAKKGGGSTP